MMPKHVLRSKPSIRALLLSACISIIPTSLTYAATWKDTVIEASLHNFPEFLELLSIPNVANKPEDIQQNAVFIQKLFEKRGFKTQLLSNPAKRPLVFAESGPSAAKTILFYMHFDGQPVIPANWSQDNPFAPVVKQQTKAGDWSIIEQNKLFQKPFNPELRIFARAASDDKAPISMFLTAIDILKQEDKNPAYHIKVLIDSEEEIGSPNLAGVIQANLELFKTDALVMLDGPEHISKRPTLIFGNRGIAQVKLTVYGPKVPLHSGHFGNYAPNPAMRLAQLLASMKDDSGRVTIEGYYDNIVLTAADKAVLAAIGDDEIVLKKRLGIAKSETVGKTYAQAMQYPSLNIRGMASGGVGVLASNIVPSEAIAELDLRTTPEADGPYLFGLLKQHVQQQGYHLIDGKPNDKDRSQYPKLLNLSLGSTKSAVRMPMNSVIGLWALEALHQPTSPEPHQKPARIRMSGGTLPTSILIDALHIPFIIVPTVNPDNNEHTHDENIRLGHFISGTQTIYSLLTTPFGKPEWKQ